MKQLLPRLLLMALLTGCLPARRDLTTTADAAVDDVVDDAGDTTATTGDTKSDAKDTADVPDEDVPILGCKTDEACAGYGDPCHSATCDTQTGLCTKTAVADDAPCVGVTDLCAASTTCKAGVCVKVPNKCDDGNPCTVDTCDPAIGCSVNVPVPKTCGIKKDQACGCDDGNTCTLADFCNGIKCEGTARTCSDGNECTADTCVPATGCAFAAKPENSACDDGQAFCTTGDKCVSGTCKGTPLPCPADGNACDFTICLEMFQGCHTEPYVGAVCDDGDPCTDKDACDTNPLDPGTGSCQGKAKNCDDKNACTDDACDPLVGCTHAQTSGATCATTDACAVSGICDAGVCTASSDPCNDGNACTDDACDVKKGCVHTNNTSPCNDGNACTYSEACADGVCGNSLDVSTDDGNDCTVDACDPVNGPSWTIKNNGVACGGSVKTTCAGGICQPTKPCGDGICGAPENTSNCPADCPLSGGQCSAADSSCIDTCTTKTCSDAISACTVGDDGCAAITTCAKACSDAACTLKCLISTSAAGFPTSLQLWLNVQWCRSAQCVGNGWLGKPCMPGTSEYAACSAGCESGFCLPAALTCETTNGCPAQRACLGACAADATCEAACVADPAATKAAKALLLCSMQRCQ